MEVPFEVRLGYAGLLSPYKLVDVYVLSECMVAGWTHVAVKLVWMWWTWGLEMGEVVGVCPASALPLWHQRTICCSAGPVPGSESRGACSVCLSRCIWWLLYFLCLICLVLLLWIDVMYSVFHWTRFGPGHGAASSMCCTCVHARVCVCVCVCAWVPPAVSVTWLWINNALIINWVLSRLCY